MYDITIGKNKGEKNLFLGNDKGVKDARQKIREALGVF